MSQLLSHLDSETSDRKTPTRWIHWSLLAAILLSSLGLRLPHLTTPSLWLDEFICIYRATARAQPGQTIYDQPFGVLIDPAPPTGFHDAPPWWKIWTGLSFDMHPPVYYIVLRWWIDVFGDGDLATRALSIVADLASAAVLFEILRRRRGPWPALAAAGLLAFSAAHIQLSQETRSYTLLVLFALLTCLMLINIERRGPSLVRLLTLVLLSAATALTHYFSAGALSALGIYTMLRMRGRTRVRVMLSFASALLLVAIVWGPFFWKYRDVMQQYDILNAPPGSGVGHILFLLTLVPARLVLNLPSISFAAIASVAVLVYLLPIVKLRKDPDALLWWLWMSGTVLLVAALDLVRHTQILIEPRYTFLASPAMYALLSLPLSARGPLRWIIPSILLICALFYGVDRTYTGPQPRTDFRTMAADLRNLGDSSEPIVFTAAGQYVPQAAYLGLRHYLPDWHHPVIFLLQSPPDPATMDWLSHKNEFWMVGQDSLKDTQTYFPGCHPGLCRPFPPNAMLWKVTPPH